MTVIRKYIPEWIKEPYRYVRAMMLSIGISRSLTFEQPEDEIEASKDISVIVAIHDSPQLTQRCLNSIEKYGAHAEIILVDDGSRMQETVDLIQNYQQQNNWLVVRSKAPKGHSHSCESGSRVATRPYLCFLNSDTVITPWSWSGAKKAFDMDQKIAVTGPTTSWTATKQKNPRAMYCRNYWTDNQICAFAKRCISNLSETTLEYLPYVGGFAFFIRRSIWIEFGGFDRNLPDYGNEVELCRRLVKSNFKIAWTKDSYIHHFGRGTYNRIFSQDTINKKGFEISAYINNLHKEQT